MELAKASTKSKHLGGCGYFSRMTCIRGEFCSVEIRVHLGKQYYE